MKEKIKKIVKKFWRLVLLFVIVCMSYVAGVTTRAKLNNESFFYRNRKEIIEKVRKELEDDGIDFKNLKIVSDGKGIVCTADEEGASDGMTRMRVEIFENKGIVYKIYDVEFDSSKWATYLGDEYSDLSDMRKE